MFKVNAKTPLQLCNAIYTLVGENLAYFDAQKRAIDILETPVFYKREPKGQNRFLNIRDLLDLGYGDCEDLAAALVSYFIFLKYEARPVLTQTGPHLYHVTVEVKEQGKWVQIDPSRIKGMK